MKYADKHKLIPNNAPAEGGFLSGRGGSSAGLVSGLDEFGIVVAFFGEGDAIVVLLVGRS